jgi:uncharacterized membrane protein YqjE
MLDVQEPHLLSLVRELVDAVGALVAAHLRLARVELTADVSQVVRRAALAGLALALALVGYGLACTAGALALARVVGAPLGLLALAGLHLAGATLVFTVWRARGASAPLEDSRAEIDRTVAAFAPSAPVGEPEPAGPALEGALP